MNKRLKIILPQYESSCIAELHEDLAPRTCQAIWNVLPHVGRARHAMRAGQEIWTKLTITDELKSVPRENIAVYPLPGDCLYSYFPAAWEGGYRGTKDPFCDFAIWYGPDSPVYQVDGLHPMNHCATIVEGFQQFAVAAQRLIVEGEKEIVIERH